MMSRRDGDWSSAGLVRYRVAYAAVMLMCLPRYGWVNEWPDSLYTPPPGPFALLDGFPAHWFMVGLEVVVALALAALLLGFQVDAASIVASLAMMIGYGFTFSLGMIAHIILLILTPLFMAVAGWGGQRAPRAWAMRLFAWTVGLAMLTAGWSKLSGGWLDPSTHATFGTVFVYHDVYKSSGPLASALLRLDSPFLWEPMDIAAVALECGLVLTVFHWTSFRVAIAGLCIFHLAVMLMLGIVFVFNVLVYAAFVPWGRLEIPALSRHPPVWLVPPVGLATWALVSILGDALFIVAPIVVTLGAAVAAWFLSGLVLRGSRGRSTRVSAG